MKKGAGKTANKPKIISNRYERIMDKGKPLYCKTFLDNML